jgi:hypothetical protein
MAEKPTFAMDGFGKIRPLTEGHTNKGGLNQKSQISSRPPGPAPMRPASTSQPQGSSPSITTKPKS